MEDEPDIVTRLRVCTCVPHGEICREAAAEIERLRAGGCARDQNTTQYCAEAASLQAEIERLREELTASHESHGNEVGALTERLSLAIHERDEARRDRCMARAVIRWDLEHPNSPDRSQTTIILLAWQIADEEGWNCFEGRKR